MMESKSFIDHDISNELCYYSKQLLWRGVFISIVSPLRFIVQMLPDKFSIISNIENNQVVELESLASDNYFNKQPEIYWFSMISSKMHLQGYNES